MSFYENFLVAFNSSNKVEGDEEIAKELPVVNLKHGPTDTKEVLEGEMCGMSLETKNRLDLQEGDRIELFTREVRERSL